MCCKLVTNLFLYQHKKKRWEDCFSRIPIVPFQSCFCTLRWLPASVRCFLRWPGPKWPLYHYLQNTKQHFSTTLSQSPQLSFERSRSAEALTDPFHGTVKSLCISAGIKVRSGCYCASEHLEVKRVQVKYRGVTFLTAMIQEHSNIYNVCFHCLPERL